jgi:hypothetical protein
MSPLPKPFQPANNAERYLACILEEMRGQREILDRILLAMLDRPTDTVAEHTGTADDEIPEEIVTAIEKHIRMFVDKDAVRESVVLARQGETVTNSEMLMASVASVDVIPVTVATGSQIKVPRRHRGNK